MSSCVQQMCDSCQLEHLINWSNSNIVVSWVIGKPKERERDEEEWLVKQLEHTRYLSIYYMGMVRGTVISKVTDDRHRNR